MKRIIFVFILNLFFTSLIYSQLGYIPINVDYATFKGANDKTYTEVYISFYQQDLMYILEDTVNVAKFSHSVTITKNDSIIYESTRNYKNSSSENTQNFTNQFMDVFSVDMDKGTYILKVNIHDKNSNKTGEFKTEISVPEYGDDFLLSRIQFASKIDGNGDDSNFSRKNGVKIYPNVSRTFTILNPVMYFYFEGYNLQSGDDGNSVYSYNYYITDGDGKKVREYAAKQKTAYKNTIAEATGINVIALPSGSYVFNIELNDLNANKMISTNKNFNIYKPDRNKSNQQLAAQIDGYEEYTGYKHEDLIDEFEKIKYIALSEEIDIFENLTEDDGMKRFLSNFWKRRDPKPETAVNEYKMVYFENIRLADVNYSTSFKKGWRTDRGRVILIYGRPDEIERNPNELDAQPYEIWFYYSLEGGSQFIFADLSGNGNYELLHSTFRNEIKDPDWQLRIQKIRTRGYDTDFDRY